MPYFGHLLSLIIKNLSRTIAEINRYATFRRMRQYRFPQVLHPKFDCNIL